MYVCKVVIPYYILIQNYMKTSANANWYPHIVTPSNATFTVSSSLNMDSGGKDTAEEKGKASSMSKRRTESVEIEKQLKKEMTRDFLRPRDVVRRQKGQLKSKKSISVAFEPGEEMLFVNSKSLCNVYTQARPKIVLQSSSYNMLLLLRTTMIFTEG